MRDWAKYWATQPKTASQTDYRTQVEHTIQGRPYSDEQFEAMVSDICRVLDLQQDDVLLDVCCGNGVITRELARKCKEVIGLDFSEPLLEIANQFHRPANVSYQKVNALTLDEMQRSTTVPFNKVLMFGALQYFQRKDLPIILRNILKVSVPSRIILIGSIPDRERRWKFYDTHKKRLKYMYYKMTERDAIGTWWDDETIRQSSEDFGLQCQLYEQSIDEPVSHCRFDVKLF